MRAIVAQLDCLSLVLLIGLFTAPAAFAQEAYIKASNTDVRDKFGRAVAISGDTMVVGAEQEMSSATGVDGDESNNGSALAGAAYVYLRTGSTWTQQAYLKASNTDTGASSDDRFGSALAIDGDTIAVGAWWEDHEGTGVNSAVMNNLATSSGAVYVFVRNGTTWTQEAYIKASNTDPVDWFGFSVALSGDTLAVGAIGEQSAAVGVNTSQTNNLLSTAGAVYVYVRDGTTWTQQAYVKASNTGQNDEFGRSVTLDGDTLVVGARGEDSSATGVNGNQMNNDIGASGAAYVFVRDGILWTQEAYLKASNTDFGLSFGSSVSLSGDLLAVGATFDDSGSAGINGSQIDSGLASSGAAYVFARNGTAWSQEAFIKASNTGFDDYFGDSVSLDGDLLVVGARQEDSSASGLNGDQSDNLAGNSGAAYVFERKGTNWSQRAYVKASTNDRGDNFARAVAVSGDTVLIGAPREGSAATGIGGDELDNSSVNAGAAYVYRFAPSLSSEVMSVSLGAGGQHPLMLDAEPARANWFYFLLGSATGTSPGLDFGGGVVLPLVFDGYFDLILNKPNLGAFGNFIGQFDGSGQALASLTLPPGVDPSLAGVVLYHAYVSGPVLGTAQFVSNPVPVELTL